MVSYNGETEGINFHFTYPDPADPLLAELKRMASITVDPAKSDLITIKTIAGYVHALFTHDGNNSPSAFDPLTILKEAQAGQAFSCFEYSILANGLLWAYGIPARTVGLKTRDVEAREYGAGHAVIEFWSRESSKWVMCDVQAGIIAKSSEKLLSAFELGQAISQVNALDYVAVANSRFNPKTKYHKASNYASWILEYLYFIDTPINLVLSVENPGAQQIAMLVPMGAANPKSFQKMFEMNAIYTHSVLDFYPTM